MNSCTPCRSKHATLIEGCYPRKEGETTPCSSELSYLTFYASSRPAKLTKVGSFLQKKINKDIRRGRKENTLVSLYILKALIQSCYGDLNIFSKYLVQIFIKLLDTDDIEVIDQTCETFVVFSSYNDGSTLGIDNHFTQDYEILLEKFSVLSSYMNKDSALQLKMRYIGQRGIQAAITSQALLSSNFKQQLDILSSSLLDTLTNDNKSFSQLDEGTIDIRKSALNNDELNESYIQSVAAHTLSILFAKLTGFQVRISLGFLFDYINKHDKWWPSDLSVNIMKIVVESMQSQYKHLFVSEVLQQLDPNHIMSHKQISLISVIDTVMNANTSLLGVSVLEVLNSLFTLLVKGAQQGEENKECSARFRQGLIHSIGGLASRSYYDNQLNDMAGYLVSKLKPNTTLESVDGLPIRDYRFLVLSCLDTLKNLPLDSLTYGLSLLKDKDPQTRQRFCKSLHHHLHTPRSPHQAFLQQLLQSMLVWILLPNLNLTDVRFFYSILCILNRTFGVQATVLIISLVFKVQQSIQDSEISRQWVVESMLISWLKATSRLYKIQPLEEYADQLEQSSLSLDLAENDSIQDLPKVDETRQPVWMDRSQVVKIMSADENLREEHDTHGLELEARLFAEWGSEASIKHRIGLIQGSNESKPKLSSPWEHTSLDKPAKRDSINVSTLKEVLISPNTDESDSTTESSSPSEHNPSLNAFLTQLKTPPNNPTLSLINPPYKP